MTWTSTITKLGRELQYTRVPPSTKLSPRQQKKLWQRVVLDPGLLAISDLDSLGGSVGAWQHHCADSKEVAEVYAGGGWPAVVGRCLVSSGNKDKSLVCAELALCHGHSVLLDLVCAPW